MQSDESGGLAFLLTSVLSLLPPHPFFSAIVLYTLLQYSIGLIYARRSGEIEKGKK